VETEIGPTLREARIRRKIDLTEIEERTKIRVRYLRALENEEWDLLPGPTYTRSFIRTYASFLDLDGERLADDYRRYEEVQLAEPGSGREPPGLPPRLAGSGGPRFGAGMVGGIAAVVLILALVALGLLSGDGDDEATPGNLSSQATSKTKKKEGGASQDPQKVSILLSATAEVWVCAIAADGTPVINGQILLPGAELGPFRSGRFDLAFGNGSIELQVDGKPFAVEETPSPVGYRVTTKRVSALPEGSRPDCT
jgi:cytoskeleton protein RodZ